jgi:hypothetical protein
VRSYRREESPNPVALRGFRLLCDVITDVNARISLLVRAPGRRVKWIICTI